MKQQFFSTLDVRAEQRLDYWNEYTETFFPGMIVDSVSDIKAEYRSITIGNTHICLAKSPRARIRRWVDRTRDNDFRRALFHIQSKGITTTIQDGEHVVAGANELAVCSSDTPYELDLSQNNECLVIDCPEDVVPFQSIFGQAISARNNLYLSSLINLSISLFKQDWRNRNMADGEEEALLGILHNLLNNAISSACSGSHPEQIRDDLIAQHQRIINFVEDNLQDSSMRTSNIASRLGLKTIDIQKSFAKFGTTPTGYIHDRRLDLARQKLKDDSFDGTLTDLAYDLGFSDSAHFSRMFKTRYNISPSKFS